MGASLISGRFTESGRRADLASVLEQLAHLAAELPEEAAASALHQYATELTANTPGPEAPKTRENILRLLRAGPGSLSDQYFVDDRGRPDAERSDRFVKLIEMARKRARRLS